MKISIITTGGTIEGLDYSEKEDRPKVSNTGIEDFFTNANVSFEYTLSKAFTKDSRFISNEDRKKIVEKIRVTEDKKILVTHGTITMVETAKYLAEFNFDKTIVLVGSFVLGTEKHTDAPFNLGYATCAFNFLENGVYIAMNGEIFPWDNVVKNVELNRFEIRSDK